MLYFALAVAIFIFLVGWDKFRGPRPLTSEGFFKWFVFYLFILSMKIIPDWHIREVVPQNVLYMSIALSLLCGGLIAFLVKYRVKDDAIYMENTKLFFLLILFFGFLLSVEFYCIHGVSNEVHLFNIKIMAAGLFVSTIGGLFWKYKKMEREFLKESDEDFSSINSN